MAKFRFFMKAKTADRQNPAGGWADVSDGGRAWEDVYRMRWQYDKVVRSTHGVNCTGSCSWKIFVKNGIVAWEHQQTDYPSTGPDMPEFEPRGCPRGASFSWYLYSPLRVKYPYVRGVLLEMYRAALQETGDPVRAWASIVGDPERSARYKRARGKGGFVRISWDEATEMIAAALIHTLKTFGPDRIFGFSPIPAMSMVSYAAGARFLSLIGAPLVSFYDWYADLPPASPQIWGDQTDVPESSDWFNAGYLIVWGSNLPMTRTPDAHFMTEVRYRGTKVVAIGPDFAEYTRFADEWLAVRPGTDGALAMALGHVVLKEFYVERPTPYFLEYAKGNTDFPFLVLLEEDGEHARAGRFLTAADLGLDTSKAEWKTVVFDDASGEPAVPCGSIGFRWEDGGRWCLKKEDALTDRPIEPRLTMFGAHDGVASVAFPYFGDGKRSVVRRVVPVKRIRLGDGRLAAVTTVFDLMLAHYGVTRGLDGEEELGGPDDGRARPYTPEWQQAITGVAADSVVRIAREFAQNAIDTGGKSMIIVGAGINHWFHSDMIYRAVLNLVLMVGAQGVNGGGWAHYVGQEKLRPLEGWSVAAFARDWTPAPPRLQNGTSLFYMATDQWRYEDASMEEFVSPLVPKARYAHSADYNALAVRLGWLPSYPQFDCNPLSIAEEAEKAGLSVEDYVVRELKDGRLRFAIEDPDDPRNFPRVLFVWRANLISSSAKGHEYFLKHLLGTDNGLMNEDDCVVPTREIVRRDAAPEGKLDLLVSVDFRMTGTPIYSDIVLPAATWYEKTDLSSTDMHPFIHPFQPAVPPLWEAKSDWEAFKAIAARFSEMAARSFDGPVRDVVAAPLAHDSPDELAQPFGKIRDWRKGEAEPVPGRTMPRLWGVERDYSAVLEKMTALGPLVAEKPIGVKGIQWSAVDEYERLKSINGVTRDGKFARGCPRLQTDAHVCETILALSSTTNGKMAVRAWEALERKTSLKLKDLAEERAEDRMTLASVTARPQTVITSPAFSGSERGGRRYSPFVTNVERRIPWRTLTGRQHFFLDHELLAEFGEQLAVYKPPLVHVPFRHRKQRPDVKGRELVLMYLTPHNKWSIHSMFFDSQPMLTLFRGGPTVWLNADDAAEAEIADNDWIECFNENGTVVARAVVSHRLPRGVAFMYHAQDRHVYVPATDLAPAGGGTHNSPTRIRMKPTHMVGGYAQLSYGFNYYGPTGNQRDLSVVVRKAERVCWDER